MRGLTWGDAVYRRDLARGLATAHGEVSARAGLILQVSDSDGRCGIGEAAPMPGFSLDRLSEVYDLWSEVRDICSALSPPESPAEFSDALRELYPVLTPCPSLRFAIETALGDLAAKKSGLPLAKWLSPGASDAIAVNALIDAGSDEHWPARAQARWQEGYRTFKIKAGVDTPASDLKRITALRDAFTDAAIRVDVNGAWDEATFTGIAPRLAGLNIEFIEQPLPPGASAEAHRIAQAAGLALALDEEAAGEGDADTIIQNRLCEVLVIKPMVFGGISGALRLAESALGNGMQVVITSLWESDVGLSASAHLAAAIAGDTTHGFSTAGMIAYGIVDCPLAICNGRLALSNEPGLGRALVPMFVIP